MSILYDKGKDVFEDFIVTESDYSPNNLGKCESIMSLGNGYMGLRNTHEEDYVTQVRGCYVAGTYNKFDDTEVTELPNAADVLGVKIVLDGEVFNCSNFQVISYERTLNVKSGLHERNLLVKSAKGNKYSLIFKKFVSMDNLHLISHKIEIKPLDEDCDLSFTTGINGQMTNSSVQHFSEGDKRLYENKYMEAVFTTAQSKIDFVYHVSIKVQDDVFSQIQMDRRKIHSVYKAKIKKSSTFVIEKNSTIHTSRDIENINNNLVEIKAKGLEGIKALRDQSFETLLEKSEKAWNEKVWNSSDIKIKSKNSFDQLAVRFAIYHLTIMTPSHDSRMSIAAKGLSGEGYKGHVFWDTEIFCFPYFLYERPEIARKLLEYRFLTLEGARKKAESGNYEGAQFPWESAWICDGETTPIWGAADIITGEPTKIWSGFIEIHITSVVSYTVQKYFEVTGDIDFMTKYGFQIVFETANFWSSRLEYNSEKDIYEINNVVGPDEYKEKVNNNAFTNHMAHYNMELALQYYKKVKNEYPQVFERLKNEIDIDSIVKKVGEKIDKVYLPRENEELIIPQDDTYLTLETIDLTPYKNAANVGEMFNHYNLEQVNKIQVSKQADILMLLHLLEDRFEKESFRKNYDYYEPKTLHDSSLSLSTHCILAKKMDDMDLAYKLFIRAAEIDLGKNMESSNQGIHAASLGGIWQCAVLGFGGLSNKGDTLICNPKLPDNWDELKFNYYFRGSNLSFEINKERIKVINRSKSCLDIVINGETYKLTNEVTV